MSSSYSSDDDDKVVVLDTGTGFCKVGWAGDDNPSSVFPCLIGRPKDHSEGVFVGQDAYDQSQQRELTLSHPVGSGIINNWEEMEMIWSKAFEVLGANTKETPVLLTEAPLNPLDNRDKMAAVMFEKYQVPALYTALQAVLALYSTGRTTGMVLDSGDGVTHAVAIYEGYAPGHAIQRLDLGGWDLTSYMGLLLGQRGFPLTSTAEREFIRDIKEKHCYVALDPEAEKAAQKDPVEHVLPDGRTITVGDERFMCPEALFDPDVYNIESPGVHKLVYNAVQKMDIDTRRPLLSSIILSGGTTCLPGLKERMQQEISNLSTGQAKVKVVAPADRRLAVWKGGSILASLSSFKAQMLVTRKEYEEVGPSVLHEMRVKF